MHNTWRRGPEDRAIPPMPSALIDVLRQCFQVEPEARPEDMQAVVEALQAIYAQEIGQSYPREAPKPTEMLADSLNNRAISLLDLGKEEEAASWWWKALQADSHHLEATFNYGYWRWLKAQLADHDYVTQMQGLGSRLENDREYWNCQAWIHLERGDLKAIEHIRKAGRAVGGKVAELANAPDRSVGRVTRRLNGNFGWVSYGCLSLDGHFTLLGESDGDLKLLATSNGQVLCEFHGHNKLVRSVCFSPDGRDAVSCGRDWTVRLWDIASGKALEGHREHSGDINSVCFSPDGHYVLSGSERRVIGGVVNTMLLWDITGGRLIRLELGAKHVYSVCFSPDGRYALSGGWGEPFRKTAEGVLRLWHTQLQGGNCADLKVTLIASKDTGY
jgi:hypothetical protein